jgi:hypothetical protein
MKALLLLPLMALSASAAVTISFNADSLRDSSGTVAPTSTLAFLLADAGNDGFGSIIAESINQYDVLASGDTVVARFDFSTFATPGVISESVSGIDLTNFASGNQLAIVWMPGLTTAETTVGASQSYGLLTDASWVAPSDGGTSLAYQVISDTNNFFFASSPTTLSVTDAQSQASFTTPVPEPSAFAAIAGLLALGFVALRRRG